MRLNERSNKRANAISLGEMIFSRLFIRQWTRGKSLSALTSCTLALLTFFPKLASLAASSSFLLLLFFSLWLLYEKPKRRIIMAPHLPLSPVLSFSLSPQGASCQLFLPLSQLAFCWPHQKPNQGPDRQAARLRSYYALVVRIIEEQKSRP